LGIPEPFFQKTAFKLKKPRLGRNPIFSFTFPLCHLDRNEARQIMEEKKKSLRGFAAMSPERQREIARKGGESVPNDKRSFSQNPNLAAEAGRKGGQNVNPSKRSFSQNHELASAAGRKGGHASHGSGKKESPPQARITK
jgi:general stress protein YciG